MSRDIAIDLCGLPKITDFCCNYFEVLHLYKLPASAYFKVRGVRGGAFDLAVAVTQAHLSVCGSKLAPFTGGTMQEKW